MTVLHAQLENPTQLRLFFSESPHAISHRDIIITPVVEVRAIRVEGTELLLDTTEFSLSRVYSVLIRGMGMVGIDFSPCLVSLQPVVPMGCLLKDGYYIFRLFAPRASSVRLYLFERPEQSIGTEYFLTQTDQGVWEISLRSSVQEKYYAYRVDGPAGPLEMFNSQIIIGDPYARAVVTANTWRHAARCVLPGLIPDYDWEGDTHIRIDPADLVIYEMHVRDMTAHVTSGISSDRVGTYRGLIQKGARGGLEHIRRLGVNAVELMPCQHFASLEPPYQLHVSNDLYNHWNPYERNHWGYMTSYFFAPEPRFSEHAEITPGLWNTAAPAHLSEFRDMVKAFHRAGIAVIMDVVYNHTSQYDYQPLKYIDRKYYYRQGPDGAYTDASGCGNDFATEMPMARRLIVESIVHWIAEYHVDGFRFDLATMIDSETFLEIKQAAQAIHPGVILIAEPWGGGKYDVRGFSELGMSAWNDVFRNGVKGRDPMHSTGYIFGSWGESQSEDFGKWMLGSIREKAGAFIHFSHAVNYLESHDDYTLGDFIRIATGTARPGQAIRDMRDHVLLNSEQLRISRLAAVMLLAARGPVMLHAGQEFARSKVIADCGITDVRADVLDHNSYEKDDETNWLNYEHADWNSGLLEYYRGLIALRNRFRTLRHAPNENYRFLTANISIASGFEVQGIDGEPNLIVLINGNHLAPAQFSLPQRECWTVLVDEFAAGVRPLHRISTDSVILAPGCCLILVNAAPEWDGTGAIIPRLASE
ncbi:MAG: pullulanase [Bacteroidota bacterium]|jgi:pullulanase/glycogen debranching enzyme